MSENRINWLLPEERKKVICQILGHENSERKEQSIKEVDVYRGFIRPYVFKDLCCQFGNPYAEEIPVVSSINVCKRVVNNDSRLYSEGVKRTFNGVSDRQREVLELIYDDLKADNVLLKSQRYLELQQQNILHILPKNKKLILRPYKMHQLDAIPMKDNPEMAQSYIVSAFDRSLFNQVYKKNKGNGSNEDIADYDDAILGAMVFAVWDMDYQFIMNGKGELISDPNNADNLIDTTPFIDVYHEKDFTFFVECGNELVDFTVQYNTAISTEAQVVKFNGFAQPYLKGPAAIFSKDLEIGVNKLLLLPTDAEGISSDAPVEFGYANPSTDLAGVREHRTELLKDFLNTRGVSRESFEGTTSHSSGIERLLAMVKDFERSRESQSIYRNVEDQLFSLVVKWHNVAIGTDLLDPKYVSGSTISEDASVSVEFKRPEMTMTENEKLKLSSEKINLGRTSLIKELMDHNNFTRDEAVKFLAEVNFDEMEIMGDVGGSTE